MRETVATQTIPRLADQQPAPSASGSLRAGPHTAAPPSRRVRFPELAVGLLVTTAFALGAVLWHLSATSKVPALAMAAPVERGAMIEADDLRIAYLSSDDPLVRLEASEAGMVIGGVALVDLPAGSLVTPSLVADASALRSGEGVVGLALDPGQYPAMAIAPGDKVNVVRAADVGAGDDSIVIARDATVFAVQDLASDRKLVSVLASASDAEAVAASAGTGSLRLVVVAR